MVWARGGWLAAVLATAIVGPAFAQSQPVADPTKTATQPAGPPQDKPPAAAPSAFTYTLTYDLDLLGDIAGGRSQGAGVADLLKASVGYDGGLQGHDGLIALVSVEHTFGSSFTEKRVGGFQAVTAAEAQPAETRLYEAWVQQDLATGAAGVKAGLIDLNTTFDVQQTAALFLNASNGTGPELSDTGLNDPSIYPTTAAAVTGFWRPSDDWTVQAGVFDATAGNPRHRAAFVDVKLDGALFIGQVERRFGDTARVEVGAWSYAKAFPALDRFRPDGAPRDIGGDAGAYALAEGQLLARGDQGGGLSGWVRAGLANGDINPVRDYLGGGLVYTGPVAGRDKDEAGLAVESAGFGEGARVAALAEGRTVTGRETIIEATYRYAWKDWLGLQPDLQYVIRPHGDPHIPNAVVVVLRLAFSWSK
jgi:porin